MTELLCVCGRHNLCVVGRRCRLRKPRNAKSGQAFKFPTFFETYVLLWLESRTFPMAQNCPLIHGETKIKTLENISHKTPAVQCVYFCTRHLVAKSVMLALSQANFTLQNFSPLKITVQKWQNIFYMNAMLKWLYAEVLWNFRY